MYKKFTKADLRNRMVVEYRNGDRRMVVDDRLMGKFNYCVLTEYDDNLIRKDLDSVFDIMKVYRRISVFSKKDNENSLELLWERPEIKEVTMSEVEEKFGCKVKIINNNYMEGC